MAEVLIRNLDEQTLVRLKERAARNDRSLQAELQMIVERASMMDIVEGRALAARIRRKLSHRKHTDAATLLADDRQR